VNIYTALDIFVLIAMLFFGFKSIPNGFIKEFFGFVGIIIGVILAQIYNNELSFKITQLLSINDSLLFNFVAFFLILIGFWLIMFFISKIFLKIVKLSGMSMFDKLLGSMVGALKIFLLLSIVTYMLTKTNFVSSKIENLTRHTTSFPILYTVGRFLTNTDSSNISQNAKNTLNNVSNIIQEKSNNVTNVIKNGTDKLQDSIENGINGTIDDEDNSYQEQNVNLEELK
jgi:membrane protein required for colicin V production